MKKLLLANLVLLNPILLFAQENVAKVEENTGSLYSNFRLGIGLIVFVLCIVLTIWVVFENLEFKSEDQGCGCGCICIILFIVLCFIDAALAPMSLSGFFISLLP